MKITPAFSFLVIASLTVVSCRNRDKGNTPVDPAPVSPPESTQAPAAPNPAASVTTPPVGKQMITESGLKYEVLKAGTGIRPKTWDQVKVHYHGYFPNGMVFDSSIQRGEPIVFGLTDVIPGWTEGLQLMQEGSKYRFYIPWLLAYGLQGSPPIIPPKQDLMFEVELIEVIQ